MIEYENVACRACDALPGTCLDWPEKYERRGASAIKGGARLKTERTSFAALRSGMKTLGKRGAWVAMHCIVQHAGSQLLVNASGNTYARTTTVHWLQRRHKYRSGYHPVATTQHDNTYSGHAGGVPQPRLCTAFSVHLLLTPYDIE